MPAFSRLLSGLLVLSGLALAAAPVAHAQNTPRRYFVYFKDKQGTSYSVAQPQAFLSARALARRSRQHIAVQARDLPVSATYLAQVAGVAGVRVLYTSRWLNGAVVAADSATAASVAQLNGVQGTQLLSLKAPAAPAPAPAAVPRLPPPRPTTDRAIYGKAYAQAQLIGAVAMHQAGYQGEGMQIAIFDAGFPGADSLAALQPVQQQGRVLGTRNFVDGGHRVYVRNGHGTNCLSTIGAELPGYFVGTAPHAAFHLCITEDTGSENLVEETNWLAAAEYADSAGVDIISSSLGYTTFDVPALSHKYADLNGRTAIGSRAALGAARVGMVVVNAAGNDGNNGWHYIGVPADADSIISTGAVDSLRNHAYFSSYGPTADGRIKPTLSVMGVASGVLTPTGVAVRGNGTSYATPELAGLVAGFWQANPTLTAQQVIEALKRSGSQAAAPDNTLGWGIPDFVLAYNLLHPAERLPALNEVLSLDGLSVFPNPNRSDELTLALPQALRGQSLSLRIVDARGSTVSQQTLTASAASSLLVRRLPRQLAPGNYICVVKPASGPTRSVRFVQE